ncbi:MAG: exopolyphosphatase [Gemmatimonadetes bacterium]|nr:MAG: exopolyphosphatase [Gemmatimonadota bacterium]
MRLITRSDFDGLVCAVLLKEVEDIESIEFAHPKDVQDGKLEITANDILTNLPYVPGCGMWFDHHSSEADRLETGAQFKGNYAIAPSAARVVYDYYKSDKFDKYAELIEAVDRSDAAQLTVEEVTHPTGWILLSYIMDPRTGLGKFHDYDISNRQLMHNLIDLIREHNADEILEMPDIKARVERYFEHTKAFEEQLRAYSRQEKNLIITDLRGVRDLATGNRFLIYTLFPEANISMRIFDGKAGEFIVVAIGHSIFNRTSNTDVGELMSRYGGGGHRGSGTAQIPIDKADEAIEEIIDQIHQDG